MILIASPTFDAPPHNRESVLLDVFATLGVHKLIAFVTSIESREFAFFNALGAESITVRPNDLDVSHDLAPSSILLDFEPNRLALIGLDSLGADIALVLIAIGFCAFFKDHVSVFADWRFALKYAAKLILD